MQKTWHNIYRDSKKIVALPQKKEQVFPFKHDYEIWSQYHLPISRAYQDFYMSNLSKDEEAKMEKMAEANMEYYKSIQSEQDCPTFDEMGITTEELARMDEALEQENQLIHTCTNPRYRPCNADKIYEMAIFKVLMTFNEYEGVDDIEENELYYIFQETFVYACQELIPLEHINHFAASVIYNKLQGQDHIVLTHWFMIPTLMLLLPCLEAGTKVSLPAHDENFMAKDAYDLLFDFLRSEIPRITWQEQVSTQVFFEDCLVLGVDPASFQTSNLHHLNELKNVRGGFWYTNWNFLSLSSLEFKRRTFLQTKTIKAILQLPRPKRLGSKDYPAVLILGSAQREDAENIRMISIPPAKPKVKSQLNISKCLKLIASEETDTKEYFDIPHTVVMATHDTRLNPSYYALATNKKHKGQKLEHYAQVLRCQIKTEDAEVNGNILGTLVREVSLSELDASSNFLNHKAGKLVSIKLTPTLKKHLLQPNDIIFAWRGSPQTIGKNGFVSEIGHASIVGKGMCIIRPRTEAAWLYYQLNTPEVQNWIKANLSGKSLAINTEVIKTMPIAPYDNKHADDIQILHKEMLESFAALTRQKQNLQTLRNKISIICNQEDVD